MKILVLDTDSGFQQQLTAALAETFPALTAVFEIDARMALGYAVDRRPELAVIDCSVFEGSLFEYLERFAETAVPFILVSHSPDYRMIVEGMRTGARDFYVKGASPIQALLQMITRALLEGDHWRRIHAYAQQIRHRDEFVKINRAVQAGVESNVSRRKPEAARSPASLTPGNFYHFVFVAAQVGVESDAVTGGNRTSPEDLETSMLEEIAGIAGTYGGETWNRHGSIAILAFATEQPKPALLFAFEAMGLIVSSEFKLDALKRAPAFAFALSSDHIMYTPRHDRQYSDAVNWAVHAVQAGVVSNGIGADRNVFEALDGHVSEHFQTDADMPEFEGRALYAMRPYGSAVPV